jgi:hypothetical protein
MNEFYTIELKRLISVETFLSRFYLPHIQILDYWNSFSMNQRVIKKYGYKRNEY